jgi:hypothetical protein
MWAIIIRRFCDTGWVKKCARKKMLGEEEDLEPGSRLSGLPFFYCPFLVFVFW